MDTSKTPFTDIYTRWLGSLRALIPGAGAKPLSTAKQEEVAAKDEWEGEGGTTGTTIKPSAQERGAKASPKLPL